MQFWQLRREAKKKPERLKVLSFFRLLCTINKIAFITVRIIALLELMIDTGNTMAFIHDKWRKN